MRATNETTHLVASFTQTWICVYSICPYTVYSDWIHHQTWMSLRLCWWTCCCDCTQRHATAHTHTRAHTRKCLFGVPCYRPKVFSHCHICMCYFAIRISANNHFDWMVNNNSKQESKPIFVHTLVWQIRAYIHTVHNIVELKEEEKKKKHTRNGPIKRGYCCLWRRTNQTKKYILFTIYFILRTFHCNQSYVPQRESEWETRQISFVCLSTLH